jgi:NADH-quinone oxidoreductase subunit F
LTDRPLTKNFRPDGEALTLREYRDVGGYEALAKALKTMSPQEVVDMVKASCLRGRGGAGFPTGIKWDGMGDEGRRPKFFVIDADEMEPGAFKDKALMEGSPHQLIEGIILGSYATQADFSIIFIRWEYTEAQKRLRRAIGEAYGNNLLGKNILGSEFSHDIHLHVSAGRYICGEGSALLESIEGKRAIPRSRVPRTNEVGLWGNPTAMNNVETLCSVPHIVNNGATWFLGLSRSKDGGTKIYGISGKVKRPGWWELPLGTTVREILEEHAGGMRDGLKLRGLLPGGASTDFLLEEHLDAKMDFESLQAVGSRLGTGTIIVMDDKTCPVGMVHNLEKFFAQESCGWCTPCREGLPWTASILGALEEGKGEPKDLDRLQLHTRLLGPGRTFCALAPGAMEPLQSALKYFRDDFERHIKEKRCPWR